VDDGLAKRPSFCEIYVEGYGNGLNEIARGVPESTPAELTAEPEPMNNVIEEDPREPQELEGGIVHELAGDDMDHLPPLPSSDASTTTPPPMSRESSLSGASSASSEESDVDPLKASGNRILTLVEILKSTSIPSQPRLRRDYTAGALSKPRPQSSTEGTIPGVEIMDFRRYDPECEPPYVHFNTLTWDSMLEQRPMTAPTAIAARG